MPVEGPSRFKSRFSILSLLPARHPPLNISPPHPQPLPELPTNLSTSHLIPPTRTIPAVRQGPTIINQSHNAVSPIHSEYPDPVSATGVTAFSTTPVSEQEDSPPLLPPLPVFHHDPPTSGTAGSSSSRNDHGGETPKRPTRPGDRTRAQDTRHKRTAAGPCSEDDSHPTFSVTSSPSRGTGSPSRRPPPLDLTKTLEAFTGNANVGPTAGTIVPLVNPPKSEASKRAGWFGLINKPDLTLSIQQATTSSEKSDADTKGKGKGKSAVRRKKVPVPSFDPFEVCEIEEGHKYPSWKQGRVSIRPGQVIPQGMLNNTTPTIRGQGEPLKPSNLNLSSETLAQYNYDSVLHNVLLTPTYLRPSPTYASRQRQIGEHEVYGDSKRRSMIVRFGDVVRDRGSKWVEGGRNFLKMRDLEGADRSVREMREREVREMDRFRQATKPYPLRSEDDLTLPPRIYVHDDLPAMSREVHHYYMRDSPGYTEYNAGFEYKHQRSKSEVKVKEKGKSKSLVKGASGCLWRKGKKTVEDKKKKLYKWGIFIIIIILASLTIGLCTTLLTSYTTSSPNTTSSPDSASSSGSSSTSAPPAITTSTSKSLATCLNQFQTSASDNPGSYPCSDCVPLLTATSNDYLSSDVGNSTGVGAALQFCALMDILSDSAGNGLRSGGWGNDTQTCKWSGVNCDSRGRIVDLELKYPNVPSQLKSTLSNIVGLSTLKITGNNTIPAGTLPSDVFTLRNLTVVDIEYTSLTGPVANIDFSKAANLSSLSLVNNAVLGNQIPDLSKNSLLSTLSITNQQISQITEDKLPSSVTYLDLSFNSLTGQIPSFTSLSHLNTLYLTNNNFTSLPSTLPDTITTLEFTSNPGLTGTFPSSFCPDTKITDCNMQGTQLKAPTSSSQSGSSTSSGRTSTSTSTSTAASVSTPSCGVCKF